MKIQVGGLSEGIHQYHFDVKAPEIGLGEEFSDVHSDVTLDKTASQLLVSAAIHTTGAFACDRCIAPFRAELSAGYQMHYVWNEAEAVRYDMAEVEVLAPGSTVIDLAEDIRQTVLVAVPLKLLCREDCKGLCPQCGRNLNEGLCSHEPESVDTRWEKLRALQDKNSHDSR